MKQLLISFLLFCSINANAQTKEDFSEISFSIHDMEDKQDTVKIKYCIADLDKDGVADSLTYDWEKTALLFSLSTRGFETFSVNYEDIGDQTNIAAGAGWFGITAYHIRALNYEKYIYDPIQSRFRLAFISHENYENAANNGSGTYSLDLLEGEFEASMNFYDYEKEELLSCPDIFMRVDNDPVYLDDEECQIYMPGEDFFREYMEKYTPEYSDTITFLGFDIDYDFEILIGEKDGKSYSIICNEQGLNRGDIISLKVQTLCYQEAGDKSIFYVWSVGTEATKIKEGKLSQFYHENKKKINYYNIPDRYSYRVISPMDVDYFLANTTDKTLLKYFKQPGSFEIEYSDTTVEDLEQFDSYYTYFVTIVHKHKNEEKLVCKLVLHAGNDYITDYYLFDEKDKTYKRWEAKK